MKNLDITEKEANENTISFNLKSQVHPILSFRENGDIYVKGRLAENDKEVVNALREFLKFKNLEKLG